MKIDECSSYGNVILIDMHFLYFFKTKIYQL